MCAALLKQLTPSRARIGVDIADTLSPADLNDLCDATDAAILSGGGFGWLTPPAREALERYWKGVMAMPGRHLLVARVDGAICGTLQLVEPSRHNEAQTFCASLLTVFIAPYARGMGAGRRLVETAEKLAVEMGYKALQLDVRETQAEAIRLFESMGYARWGVNPSYAVEDGRMIRGFYYTRDIAPSRDIRPVT